MIERNEKERERWGGCGDGVFREGFLGRGHLSGPEWGESCEFEVNKHRDIGKGLCQDPEVGMYWLWSQDSQETSGAEGWGGGEGKGEGQRGWETRSGQDLGGFRRGVR